MLGISPTPLPYQARSLTSASRDDAPMSITHL
jgi:hypothetical protein